MNTIITHWSADNRILARQLYEQIEQEITTQWKGTWYRRLWFYFFEQEIRHDTRQKIETQSQLAPHHLLDPEYQALLARCAKGGVNQYETWDELTLWINNYIFGQGDFFELDYDIADEKIVQLMISALAQGSSPKGLSRQGPFMSDVILELRRARADVVIVSQISEGKHSYQTLLKMCGEYMGTFARVPRFVEYYSTGWSQDTIIAAVDDHDRLEIILQPSYSLECATIDSSSIIPYGYIQIENTPYSTRFGRLGYRWANCPWYMKIGVSILIVVLSTRLGGSTLLILPIVWGIIAVARTESQYLGIFQNLLYRRYTSYTTQYTEYMTLYDTMVDPEQSTKDTVQAQQLMSRWFDVIPFSGHEIMWETTSYAKRLYSYIMSFSHEESVQKDIATMNAVSQWSNDHHLSLLIIQDAQYVEQTLYRFVYLLDAMKQNLLQEEVYVSEYQAQYESIDELISGKKYSFWLWTFRNALRDGAIVAISSGVVGWMGSYLRNWSVGGSTALAAGPTLVTPTLTQSDDILLSHAQLLVHMKTEMTVDEINKFFGAIQTGKADTLWDTMVDSFGFVKGNIYTNHLMDTWWRISDDQMTSELFTSAFHSNVATSIADSGWKSMMDFLHRIYDYDNLTQYSSLLDKPRLSQTLQDLQSGQMSVSEFASLPLEQREIVTQALFYHLNPHALQGLFDGSIGGMVQEGNSDIVTGSVVDSGVLVSTGVNNMTGNIVDTGAQDHTLQLGDTLLQWLGIHTNTIDPGVTGSVDMPTISLTGDIDLSDVSELKLTIWQQFVDWKTKIGVSWAERFVRPNGDGFSNRKTAVGSSWLEKFPLPTRDRFVAWKEGIASAWSEKFARPHFSSSVIPDNNVAESIDMPHSALGVDAISAGVQKSSLWSHIRTWFKGTPPEKLIGTQTGSLDHTGVVDNVLSGLNSEDLQLSGTVIDQHALAPGQIAQFTFPMVRKDKTYS